MTDTFAYSLAATVNAFTHKEANAYIDSVLQGAFQTEVKMDRLDPHPMPPFDIPLLSKRITENNANLAKGQLINLSTARRSEDCSVPQWQFANVSFTCNLNFPDNLIINYTANVTYDNMGLVFYPKTTVKDTTVKLHITSTRQENIPYLKMFYINDIGHMTVTSRMISIGDLKEQVEPPIREGIVSQSTMNLHKILNGRFKDALEYSILKTPISFIDN